MNEKRGGNSFQPHSNRKGFAGKRTKSQNSVIIKRAEVAKKRRYSYILMKLQSSGSTAENTLPGLF